MPLNLEEVAAADRRNADRMNDVLLKRIRLLEERCAGLSARLALVEVAQTAYQRAPDEPDERTA